MPALSQNLTFKITNGNTTTNSVQVQYPTNTATTALIYHSERIKGDGYFGGSDGLHTVFWSVSNFKGTLEVQATLASEPIEADWVTVKLTNLENRYEVDTTGAVTIAGIDSTRYTTPTTTSKSYNFTGNFVWLRGRISEFTQGVMNGISINR
jgi:hypothetical protein